MKEGNGITSPSIAAMIPLFPAMIPHEIMGMHILEEDVENRGMIILGSLSFFRNGELT